MTQQQETQRKLNSLYIGYKRHLKITVEHTKQAQNIIIDYYTDDLLKSFKNWDDLLSDINFVCYGDLGVGKLLAIKVIQDKYYKINLAD